MISYLGVSRRDVGAGIAAGGSAFLGAVLINFWNFVQTFRARGFNSVSLAEYRQGSEVLFLGGIFAPIIAVFVGTIVWRVMMPDEQHPRYGAAAGVASAFGTLVVFAASIGFVFSLSEFSAGPLVGAFFEFLFLTVLIAVFGGLITAPVITPLGALVGYGYERYIVEGQG
jgi:hypothetical protein